MNRDRRLARASLAGTALLITLACTLLTPASPASAYSLNGCKFSSSSIYWHFASGTNSAYNTVIKEAASSWNVTDVTLTKQAGAGYTQVAANNWGNVSWDGYTNYACGSGGTHTSVVSIQINTYWTASYPTGKTRGVAAHEFGHDLGLAHSSSDSSPCSSTHLMTPNTPHRYACGIESPQQDDEAGVNHLY